MPFTYANITTTFTYPEDTTTQTVTGTQQSYISEATSNLCSTIWNDYAPVLSIPEAFKTIQPAGFQEPGSMYGDDNPCNFIFNEEAVLFDPPLALTEQSVEAKPTLPNANSAYPTPTDASPTAAAATTSVPTVAALPESLGLTVPSSGPVATVYTDPGPTGLHSASSQAIGDVIASVLGMTGQDQGSGQGDGGGQVTLAMASDGSEIVVNGVTTHAGSQVATSADDSENSPQTGMITVDGNTMGYTSSDGMIVIGDQTLSQGGTVTLKGESSSSSSSSSTTARRPSSASQSQAAQTAATTSGATKVSVSLNAALGLLMAMFLAMI